VEHHFDAPHREATMRRHLLLETLGYSVVHIAPATVIWKPTMFAATVRNWLTARAAMINSLSTT
jgi:high-affinity K+ transport system ATPase subunit B